MRISYSPHVAPKIREFIKAWGIVPKFIASEINRRIEDLAETPSLGQPDPERSALFADASFYTFVIDAPPIVKRITVAYIIAINEDGPVLQVLDVSPAEI